MTKRLWICEARVDVAVLADTEEEALEIAGRALPDEAANVEVTEAREMVKIEDVPREWLGSLPYGGDGERTCRVILGGKP